MYKKWNQCRIIPCAIRPLAFALCQAPKFLRFNIDWGHDNSPFVYLHATATKTTTICASPIDKLGPFCIRTSASPIMFSRRSCILTFTSLALFLFPISRYAKKLTMVQVTQEPLTICLPYSIAIKQTTQHQYVLLPNAWAKDSISSNYSQCSIIQYFFHAQEFLPICKPIPGWNSNLSHHLWRNQMSFNAVIITCAFIGGADGRFQGCVGGKDWRLGEYNWPWTS